MEVIKILCISCVFAANVINPSQAESQNQHDSHRHHNMTLDNTGMVMNNNHLSLPEDCKQLGRDYHFKVYAGTKFATDYPGTHLEWKCAHGSHKNPVHKLRLCGEYYKSHAS